jgi:hypothetical protein
MSNERGVRCLIGFAPCFIIYDAQKTGLYQSDGRGSEVQDHDGGKNAYRHMNNLFLMVVPMKCFD